VSDETKDTQDSDDKRQLVFVWTEDPELRKRRVGE
jgi:hypothetical protein